jgi:hypothetical protein
MTDRGILPFLARPMLTLRTPLSVERAMQQVRTHVALVERTGDGLLVQSGSVGEETFTVRYWFLGERYDVLGRIRDGRTSRLVLLRCRRTFGSTEKAFLAVSAVVSLAMLVVYGPEPGWERSWPFAAVGLVTTAGLYRKHLVPRLFVESLKELWVRTLDVSPPAAEQ